MKPLEGIKVLELSTYFAAPMCGRLLADWGAEVIKVEGPAGDPYRTAYKGQKTPSFEDGCPSFDLENSNKKFVCLDAKKPSHHKALMKLARQADILITNNRPKALAKMHMTYEEVKEANPAIVYADMSGYGSKGPLRDKPGFDYTSFLSRSGMLADLSPKNGNIMSFIGGFGDHITSLSLAAGICAALVKAKTTGEGEHVSTSLLQNAIFIQSNGILTAYYGREFPRDHFDTNSPLLNCYKCKDGEWLFLAAPVYNKIWPKLCQNVFERPDLAEDPRYVTVEAANEHKAEQIAELDKVFAGQDSSYWIGLFEKYDIPHEKLAHYKDVLVDEQAWANNFLMEHTYAGDNRCVVSNTPVDFESVPENVFTPGRPLGADTAEVLAKAGLSEEEISEITNEIG